MTESTPVRYGAIVPYLRYEDAGKMLKWLSHTFGFVEKARDPDDGSYVRNAEMLAGESEVWLDGSGPGFWDKNPKGPVRWIGVWVDDPDAMYERVKQAGVEVAPPEDKLWGVRICSVEDPEGYTWGFMKRIPVTSP